MSFMKSPPSALTSPPTRAHNADFVPTMGRAARPPNTALFWERLARADMRGGCSEHLCEPPANSTTRVICPNTRPRDARSRPRNGVRGRSWIVVFAHRPKAFVSRRVSLPRDEHRLCAPNQEGAHRPGTLTGAYSGSKNSSNSSIPGRAYFGEKDWQQISPRRRHGGGPLSARGNRALPDGVERRRPRPQQPKTPRLSPEDRMHARRLSRQNGPCGFR